MVRMPRSRPPSTLPILGGLVLALACTSGSADPTAAATGGGSVTAGTGGALGVGGSLATGATGGTTPTGGTPGASGAPSGGGSPSNGGASPLGGSSTVSGGAGGGTATSGGSPAMGGGGTPASGEGGSTSSGGASVSGGSTATRGEVSTASCDNGLKDGSETGVDCGGSCEACPVYQIDPPLEDNPDARSGCEPNGTGFMCAQSMVFSPQMLQAAKDDWSSGDPPFVYGVVGHDPDPGGVDSQSSNYASTCCQCYQLVFKGPSEGSVSVPVPQPMVVQAFNTYAGGPTAFDIFMAVGGHGNFNGCTENGRQYTGYPDTGGDWSGGVRATRYGQCRADDGYTQSSIGSAMCQDFIASECQKATASEPTQSISQQSCIETNRVDTHYHMNWNVVAKRVECPENLTRVTGCRLNGQGLPTADPEIDTVAEAMQNGFLDNGYHTTTMQDCCRPTCAWPDNTTNTADPYSLFYSCDGQGNPYTE